MEGKRPGSGGAPLIACTTWMPSATVSAPGPAALAVRKEERRVAQPLLIATSLSVARHGCTRFG